MAITSSFPSGGGGDLPVEVKILETICENVIFDSNTSYTLPQSITLDRYSDYYLSYKEYQPNSVMISNLHRISCLDTSNNSVEWLRSGGQGIVLTSSSVTDNFTALSMDCYSSISIYKVKVEITNGLDHMAMNLEGDSNYQPGNGAHAEGSSTFASGQNSHTEGLQAIASGSQSHAEGEFTIASGISSHAEGGYTQASGEYSHVEGYGADGSGEKGLKATGFASHAEGNLTQATGTASHAEGYKSTTYGYGSHAEGSYTSTSGNYSHAEGLSTIASGATAHAEGAGSIASESTAHAEGQNTTASGRESHAEGSYSTASGEASHAEGANSTASGLCSHAGGCGTIANANNQTAIGKFNVSSTEESDRLIVGKGTSDTARSNCLRVTDTGVYATGAHNSSGADYAELFEWSDRNPDGEDRIGRFVTLDGDKIRLASSNDDFILGIVSGNPSVVGDVHDDQWQGMYLYDVYGRPIWEDIDVPDEVVERPDPEDPEKMISEVIIPAHTEHRQKLNPDYDNSQKYIPRSERPEWDAVGMLGKLVAVDDGTCQTNGWCNVGDAGVATASNKQTKYRCMSRIDDTHVRILIL